VVGKPTPAISEGAFVKPPTVRIGLVGSWPGFGVDSRGGPGHVPNRATRPGRLAHQPPPSLRSRTGLEPGTTSKADGRCGTLNHLFKVASVRDAFSNSYAATDARFHPDEGPTRGGPQGWGRGRLSVRPAHLSVARHPLQAERLRVHRHGPLGLFYEFVFIFLRR